MNSFKFVEPSDINSAIQLKMEYGKDALLLAGGTDVLVNIKSGKVTPKLVISLNKINDLNDEIAADNNGITIGSRATLSEIVKDKNISQKFPALAQAANIVGSKQIRNRGTLAGNICNASPAADTATPLLIYDAIVNVIGNDGKRSIPINEFFIGPRKTALGENEIVESVFIPFDSEKYASVYDRLSKRQGVDLALAGTSIKVSEKEVKIALGAVGPKPFRAFEAEAIYKDYIDGKISDDEFIQAAVKNVSTMSDLRSSKEYKYDMIQTLVRRTLREATALLNEMR